MLKIILTNHKTFMPVIYKGRIATAVRNPLQVLGEIAAYVTTFDPINITSTSAKLRARLDEVFSSQPWPLVFYWDTVENWNSGPGWSPHELSGGNFSAEGQTLEQTLTGLEPGVTYRYSGYLSWET